MYTKKIFVLAIATVTMFFWTGCGEKYEGYQKDKSGLHYCFHTKNDATATPQNGDVLTIQMIARDENDSVVVPIKSLTTMMQTPKFQGDIYDALGMMHEGDSATFIINAKNYFNVYYGYLPPFVKNEKTKVWITIKVDSILPFAQYQANKIAERKNVELQAIQSYLEAHNFQNTQPTSNGLYYIEVQAGKGNSPLTGQSCIMNYTGKFLTGEIFDSNVGKGPFSFPLGMGNVIKGWDEGVALMKKGGKAIFVIPSELAYGERGAGNIPPYTPLMFEVELVDVN